MKRCPECRRDYYDETLLYCLDDGNALLDGPASANEQATAIMSATGANSRIKPHRFNRRWLTVSIAILAVILIAGVGFGIYKLTGRSPTNVIFESAKITRLTNSGKVILIAISPDGKWLAYVDDDGGQQSVWLQQVAVAGSNIQIRPPAVVFFHWTGFFARR